MNQNEDFQEFTPEEINQALMSLVSKGIAEMGVDENGEIVVWMTEDQKRAARKKMAEFD